MVRRQVQGMDLGQLDAGMQERLVGQVGHDDIDIAERTPRVGSRIIRRELQHFDRHGASFYK